MAPRQRNPPPASASGILSNVFGFVSREIESFVATATGLGDGQAAILPQASTSRVKLEDSQGKKVKKVKRDRGRPKHARGVFDDGKADARSQKLARARNRSSSPPLPIRRTLKKDKHQTRRLSPSLSPQLSNGAVEGNHKQPDIHPPQEGHVHITKLQRLPPHTYSEDEGLHFPSRTPPPIPALLLPRSTPITMPGSFYPRSESIMPDFTPMLACRTSNLPRTPSPPLHSTCRPELGPPRPANHSRASDTTLRPNATTRDQKRESDSTRISTISEEDRFSQPASIEGHSGGRSINAIESEGDRKEVLREGEASDGTRQSSKAKGKERACDTSGEIRVRGKERELRAAREAQLRDEPPRDDEERGHDKQRIRMLEKEIERLKAQLAARNSTPSQLPPPPPPPPPPFRPSSSLPSMPFKVPDLPSGVPRATESFLANVRANLKHTAPPVEVPINDVAGRTRRAGQPTVNVPTDKMAAFLNEMKTVRLRRISTGGGTMPPPSLDGRNLLRSNGNTSARGYTHGERSFSAVEAQIGEKRKRDANGDMASSKRRLTTFALASINTGSSTTSSSSRTSYDSRAAGSSTSTSFAPALRLSGRTWPSVSTTETDITTPSLCSDNETEQRKEVEENLPHTPPHPARREGSMKQGSHAPPDVEVIDVDAELEPTQIVEPDLPEPAKSDIFAKRPPQSPLPAPAPRRVRPPARKRTKRLEIQFLKPTEGDDSLLISQDNSGADASTDGKGGRATEAKSRLPVPVKVTRAPSGEDMPQGQDQQESSAVSNRARRRRTLDEELRRAGDVLWVDELSLQPGDSERHSVDMDSGELVGVGTKNARRGFLKGGGAAGTPVFMGVGNIQGAEDDGDDEAEGSDDNIPPPPVRPARRVRS